MTLVALCVGRTSDACRAVYDACRAMCGQNIRVVMSGSAEAAEESEVRASSPFPWASRWLIPRMNL